MGKPEISELGPEGIVTSHVASWRPGVMPIAELTIVLWLCHSPIESRRMRSRRVCAARRAALLNRVGIEGVEMNRGGRLFDWAYGVGRIPLSLVFLLVLCNPLEGRTSVKSDAHGEAVRLNNIGTALMSQQLLEKAIDKFGEAYRLDPSLTVAELNRGIALLYLQRLPEATTALQHAAAQAPNNPRIWYVSGLVYRSDNKPQQSMEAFQRVLKLDPSNADSHYFLGSLLLDQRDL